jgi:hypothetical protein
MVAPTWPKVWGKSHFSPITMSLRFWQRLLAFLARMWPNFLRNGPITTFDRSQLWHAIVVFLAPVLWRQNLT